MPAHCFISKSKLEVGKMHPAIPPFPTTRARRGRPVSLAPRLS